MNCQCRWHASCSCFAILLLIVTVLRSAIGFIKDWRSQRPCAERLIFCISLILKEMEGLSLTESLSQPDCRLTRPACHARREYSSKREKERCWDMREEQKRERHSSLTRVNDWDVKWPIRSCLLCRWNTIIAAHWRIH